MEITAINPLRKPKSERLSELEKKSLIKYRDSCNSKFACALSIGIDQNVLARVCYTGSASPITIQAIRAKLSSLNL